MSVVIDVQGFKLENNKFVVKEFAAYDGNKICHYVFKAPFRMSLLPPHLHKQAVWLMENHHCINWEDGFVPLHKFSNILQHIIGEYERVLIKGKEKADYIRKYTPRPVTELDEQPSLKFQKPKCFFHSKDSCVCALSNVFYLYDCFLMKE